MGDAVAGELRPVTGDAGVDSQVAWIDACLELDVDAGMQERHRIVHVRHALLDVFAKREDGKVVIGKARDEVTGERLAQELGQLDQELVPARDTEGRIDELEVVDVEKHVASAGLARRATRLVHRPLRARQEAPHAGKPREGVVVLGEEGNDVGVEGDDRHQAELRVLDSEAREPDRHASSRLGDDVRRNGKMAVSLGDLLPHPREHAIDLVGVTKAADPSRREPHEVILVVAVEKRDQAVAGIQDEVLRLL